MMTSGAILILAKNPEEGRVKTRLAKTLGACRALSIYKELYTQTLTLAAAMEEGTPYVFQSPERDSSWFPSSRLQSRLQADGDLGDRMLEALREGLQEHEKAVMIGADCPGLEASHLKKAFSALDQVDLVLGPSEDGGFYLLGSKEPYPDLFLDRSWSHEEVLAKTVDLASELGLSLHILSELYDIDYETDWQRWQKEREL